MATSDNTTDDIVYIKAGQEHVELLIRSRIDFFIEMMGAQPEDKIEELAKHLREYLPGALAQQQYIGWLAMSGDEIAGAGGASIRHRPGSFTNPTGREAYVMSMYTSPNHRKKGIATTILNNLVADVKLLGIVMIELHATKDGEPVYVKNGFKLHPEPTYRLHVPS